MLRGFFFPMGEQHNNNAAAARCVHKCVLRTHGKHYAASGTLINGEIVQICFCFLFMYFDHVCHGFGLWV